MSQNDQKHQKWPKTSKNTKKGQKSLKIAKCQFWGVPRGAPRAPKKNASLSNRRIGTRNTDSHMVSIQKGQKSTPIFRACARPPKKGRIKAKLKFFFELFQKTSKITIFGQILAFFHDFLPFLAFSPLLPKNTILSHFEPILTLFRQTLAIASYYIFIQFYDFLLTFRTYPVY